jgi:hypothetical protein
VFRYRTQVEIPADRSLCLILPEDFPEGPAIVTVYVLNKRDSEGFDEPALDPDREDIEWWEEFEDEPGQAG